MNKENNVSYYDEYLGKILDIVKMTTKENSILICFNIEDGKCKSKVELLEQDGTVGALKNVNFACTENFYSNFLERLIIEYLKINEVALTDIIDIDGDKKYTFRIVGESNDLFSIDGISKEYALKLKEMVDKPDTENAFINEDGISNTLSLVMLASLMTVIILSLIVFIW
jgi:hypothetical protein